MRDKLHLKKPKQQRKTSSIILSLNNLVRLAPFALVL